MNNLKLLILIISNKMNIEFKPYILKLKENLINMPYIDCEIACISSNDDTSNYEDVLGNIKYKVINNKLSLDKICDFISNCNEVYDWYIKIRPEIELIEQLSIDKINLLCKKSINARVRSYIGNKKILYGCSLGGKNEHHKNTDIIYDINNEIITLDDAIYIFHYNIIKNGGFMPIIERSPEIEHYQNETTHTYIWQKRNIQLNPCGINVIFHHLYHGNLESTHVNII